MRLTAAGALVMARQSRPAEGGGRRLVAVAGGVESDDGVVVDHPACLVLATLTYRARQASRSWPVIRRWPGGPRLVLASRIGVSQRRCCGGGQRGARVRQREDKTMLRPVRPPA